MSYGLSACQRAGGHSIVRWSKFFIFIIKCEILLGFLPVTGQKVILHSNDCGTVSISFEVGYFVHLTISFLSDCLSKGNQIFPPKAEDSVSFLIFFVYRLYTQY